MSAKEHYDAMHRAFGSPGDHGYGTKQGDALLSLYRYLGERIAEEAKQIT